MKGKNTASWDPINLQSCQIQPLDSTRPKQNISYSTCRSYLLPSSTAEGGKAIILLRQSVDACCYGNQRLRP